MTRMQHAMPGDEITEEDRLKSVQDTIKYSSHLEERLRAVKRIGLLSDRSYKALVRHLLAILCDQVERSGELRTPFVLVPEREWLAALGELERLRSIDQEKRKPQ